MDSYTAKKKAWNIERNLFKSLAKGQFSTIHFNLFMNMNNIFSVWKYFVILTWVNDVSPIDPACVIPDLGVLSKKTPKTAPSERLEISVVAHIYIGMYDLFKYPILNP